VQDVIWKAVRYQDEERELLAVGSTLAQAINAIDDYVAICIATGRRVPDEMQGVTGALGYELALIHERLEGISEYLD
jgi:hypothetical protein